MSTETENPQDNDEKITFIADEALRVHFKKLLDLKNYVRGAKDATESPILDKIFKQLDKLVKEEQ